MSNSKKLLFVVFCAFVVQPMLLNPAYAQYDVQKNIARDQISSLHEQRRRSVDGNEPLLKHQGMHVGNNPHLRMQLELEERHGKGISEGFGYYDGREPTFPQIKFYKTEEPTTLNGRIDALLHGVTVSLPPKYDLYGYELRRYMSLIAGPEVLGNKKRVATEIANTKRAKIILEYWGKELREDIKAIKAEIEADDKIDPTTRTSFKFKSGKVRAFLVEANSWVDNNQKMLEMLYKISDRYRYSEPSLDFQYKEELNKFANLFRARQKALEIMEEYPPFRMMIY